MTQLDPPPLTYGNVPSSSSSTSTPSRVTDHDWAPPFLFLFAFGESVAVISLIFPATVVLVGIGGLVGAGTLDFWPLWLAASTHEGEELLAARLHRSLAHDISGLLTLIVPRHPKRGDDIATALRQEGFALARRSQGEPIGPQTALYLADTLGEMGLFYRVAPVVLMGKTLIGQGGQNPLEPARLGAAILSGPHIGNFDAVFMMLAKAKGAEILPDSTQVEVALRRLLGDPAAARAMGGRAQALAGDPRPLLQTMEALRPMLRSLPLDARP